MCSIALLYQRRKPSPDDNTSCVIIQSQIPTISEALGSPVASLQHHPAQTYNLLQLLLFHPLPQARPRHARLQKNNPELDTITCLRTGQ